MRADELVAVDQDVDDMSDESILDIVKGDTISEQLEDDNRETEGLKWEINSSRSKKFTTKIRGDQRWWMWH